MPDVAGLVPEVISRRTFEIGIEGSEELGGGLGHGCGRLPVLGLGCDRRRADQTRKQEADWRGKKKTGKVCFHLAPMGERDRHALQT